VSAIGRNGSDASLIIAKKSKKVFAGDIAAAVGMKYVIRVIRLVIMSDVVYLDVWISRPG